MTSWSAANLRSAVEREARRLPVDDPVVRVDGEDVVIEFSTPAQSGCRFGARFEAMPKNAEGESVDTYASQIRWNVQETIEALGQGLPKGNPGEVTWIN